jgi:hypothetical protein
MLTTPLENDLANIPKLRSLLKAKAVEVVNTTSPAVDFKRIVEALLSRTDEQLDRLLSALNDLSLAMMAYATRNLLELNIWTGYVLASNDNSKRFAQDWLLGGIGLLEGLQGWYTSHGGSPAELTSTAATLSELRKQQSSWGLENTNYLKVNQVAKELGHGDEYDNLFKVYSKLVHPTSWSVLGMEDKLHPEGIGKLLLFRGVYYGGKTYCLIRDHLDKYGLVPI